MVETRITDVCEVKVTHLWEYGSLEERAEVRAKLAGDQSWISEYVTHLLPMLDNQVNSVVYQPKWAADLLRKFITFFVD